LVTVGELAPQFELEGVEGDGSVRRSFSSSEWRGAPVVLVFYPADNSPVCTLQLRSYTEDIGAFAAVDAQVVAISPQSVDAHGEFARSNGGFAFPLLSDPDKEVGRAFGTLGPLGFYRRCVVVLDGEGVVRWAHRAAAGLTFRPVSEIVAAVRAIG
jgi:thioredoxin-dependent peroxiredoxin